MTDTIDTTAHPDVITADAILDSTVPAPRKPRAKINVTTVTAALKKSRGMIAVAARMLGSDRQTVYNFLKRHPELKTVLEDEREYMTDAAEIALNAAIVRGEAWAVCFYLKTQGRSRGYIERIEQTTPAGRPIEIVVVNHPTKEPTFDEDDDEPAVPDNVVALPQRTG